MAGRDSSVWDVHLGLSCTKGTWFQGVHPTPKSETKDHSGGERGQDSRGLKTENRPQQLSSPGDGVGGELANPGLNLSLP